MSSFRVAFHTLGCKLNQLESESIAQSFAAEGFIVSSWEDGADLYVVNTCTVTSKAEQKARRMLRWALKHSPEAVVIATGCYAQLDGEAIAAVASALDAALGGALGGAYGERLVVVSGDLKAALLDLPRYLADVSCTRAQLPAAVEAWASGDAVSGASSRDRFRFDPDAFAFHSRASLKIQDGCDNACAYCRVRLARGRSVSLAPEIVLERLRDLENRGYAEAVLTGINLSRYRGTDAEGARLDFVGLLDLLLRGTDRITLRLSSTEPDAVDERFARTVAHPRVRPHFHLAVQSLSDTVLARMRRHYGSDIVRAAVSRLRSAVDDPFLACDMIAGFPGESEEEFLETYRAAGALDFAWIHAFPFSPRPGTEAAKMKGQVPQRLSAERIRLLGDLAAAGRRAYLRRWTGKSVDAVAERSGDGDPDLRWFPAVSGNYLKLRVVLPEGRCSGALPAGTAFRCRIREADSSSGVGQSWPATEGPALEEGEGEGAPFDAYAEFLEILPY